MFIMLLLSIAAFTQKPILSFKDKYDNMQVLNSKRFKKATPIPTDYIAYYKADGNGDDETGNYNGTPESGITYVADRNSVANSAFYFANAYKVDLPSALMAELTGAFSLNFWLYIDSVTSLNGIFGGKGLLSDNSKAGIAITEAFTDRVYFEVYSSTFRYILAVYYADDIPIGAWCNICFQYDGNLLAVYINGVRSTNVSVDTAGVSDAYPTGEIGAITIDWGSQTIKLGQSGFTYLDGKLDQFRVFNRALSLDEIGGIYNE